MKEKVIDLYYDHGLAAAIIAVAICLILIPAIVFGIFCLEGLGIMVIWNLLVCKLFAVAKIGYWLSVGIAVAFWFIRKLIFGCNVKVKWGE